MRTQKAHNQRAGKGDGQEAVCVQARRQSGPHPRLRVQTDDGKLTDQDKLGYHNTGTGSPLPLPRGLLTALSGEPVCCAVLCKRAFVLSAVAVFGVCLSVCVCPASCPGRKTETLTKTRPGKKVMQRYTHPRAEQSRRDDVAGCGAPQHLTGTACGRSVTRVSPQQREAVMIPE